MFDFHEKRKIRSILYSKWLIACIFMLSALLSVSVYHRYTAAKDMRDKLETKKAELSELEQRAQALESKVEYLKNERGVEEELRNRFDVVKEGEQMVVLLDDREEGTSKLTNPEEVDPPERSFWDFLKFW